MSSFVIVMSFSMRFSFSLVRVVSERLSQIFVAFILSKNTDHICLDQLYFTFAPRLPNSLALKKLAFAKFSFGNFRIPSIKLMTTLNTYTPMPTQSTHASGHTPGSCTGGVKVISGNCLG